MTKKTAYKKEKMSAGRILRVGKKEMLLVILGAVLIFSALFLISYNKLEDFRAGQAGKRMLAELDPSLFDVDPAKGFGNLALSGEKEASAGKGSSWGFDPESAAIFFEKYPCAGILNIPNLELTLPVWSEWNYDKLKSAPCVHFGSVEDENLFIAAHNYSSQFGRLKELEAGDEIRFWSKDGSCLDYSVAQVTVVKPSDVKKIKNSGYALVLYTCTPGGKSRVAVYCTLF